MIYLVTKKDFVSYWQQNIKYMTRKPNTLYLAKNKPPLPVEYTQKELSNILEIFVTTLEDILKEGEGISFSGFGSFKPSLRKEFIAHNPQTGERTYHPPTMTVRFHMSNLFRKRISDVLTCYLRTEDEDETDEEDE